MKLKLTLGIIFMVLLMSVVYSIVVVDYVTDDEFYFLRGAGIDAVFEVNATPSGPLGIIQTATLWTNLTGTWEANFTNATNGTIGTKINRKFLDTETSIYLLNLTDGLVFIWNVYACDNISNFTREDISLDENVYVIFDNYTNTTGDGFCNASCSDAHIIKAGRGRVVNYPLASIDGVENTTTDEDISGNCAINGSADGYFYCNQTREDYNGTDLLATSTLITSSVNVNYTIDSVCRFVGTNQTAYVEDAPNITLIRPLNGSYDADGDIDIQFAVTGDSDTYTCQVYSNDTGSWVEEGGGNIATNDTNKTTSKVFSEKIGLVWNVRCSERTNSNIYGWAPDNNTITIDLTNPAITIHSPSDDSYQNHDIGTDLYSAKINITVVDNNADSCFLKLNGTADRNVTLYTSGVPFDLNFNKSDGNYEWNVVCNDSSARTTETANRTITIDTVGPTLSKTINYSSPTGDCKGFTVEFGMSEAVNATFTYGLATMAQTYDVIEADYSTNQTVTLTFNDSYETDFYTNISFCDRASNCNDTNLEMIITSPIPLCTGWSLWSVYHSAINLSDYRSESGADFVYFWNNTGQSWIYSTTAGSLNEEYSLGIGDVVQLYESTNTTHFRNTTIPSQYYVNITGGHAYFGLYNAFTFGNISHEIFLNESGGNVTDDIIWTGGLEFRIDYLSGFNNSNQQYIDAPYQWAWNNDSILGGIYKNGLDTLWAYIPYNISINFTADGEVIGNWT